MGDQTYIQPQRHPLPGERYRPGGPIVISDRGPEAVMPFRSCTAPRLERTAQVFAIVRDALLIVFMLATILTGLRLAGALADYQRTQQQTQTPQPCLVDPTSDGCGG